MVEVAPAFLLGVGLEAGEDFGGQGFGFGWGHYCAPAGRWSAWQYAAIDAAGGPIRIGILRVVSIGKRSPPSQCVTAGEGPGQKFEGL
jgi:hypothetical protein